MSDQKKQGLIQRLYGGMEVADRRIILASLFLLMFGLVMIYSSSSAQYGSSFLRHQAVLGAAGVLGMFFVSAIDYHHWMKFTAGFYIISMFSLLLVRVNGLGVSKNGANRWIEIRGISIQPSELMKPVIIFVLAYLFVEMGRNIATIKGMFLAWAPVILAVGAIYIITDNLSTALIVLGIAAVMFFVAFPDRRIYILTVLVAAAAIIFAFYYYSHVVVPSHYAQDTENFRDVDLMLFDKVVCFDTYRQRMVAEAAVKPDGVLRPDAVRDQKFHQTAQAELTPERFAHLHRFFHGNALQPRQLLRLVLHDVQRTGAEGRDDQRSRRRADALDDAAGEVFIDLLRALRQSALGSLGLKLSAVRRVARPAPVNDQLLPGRGEGQAAGDGHILSAVCLYRENGIAVFFIRKDDLSDGAGELGPFGLFHAILRSQQVFQKSAGRALRAGGAFLRRP